MTIAEFDHLTKEKKKELLLQCCGSSCWVEKMLTILPVEDLVELQEAAEEKWFECSAEDQLEAFARHPEIGDIHSLKEKFSSTAAWAANEQSGVENSSEEVLRQLADTNKLFKEKFGYIFIIDASGKSAEEILSSLKDRLTNTAEEEIGIAAEEQNKITQLRLEKLFA